MVTESGCWIWTAGVNHSGYGIIGINQFPRLAHRVAYELLKGEIPEGLVLDHLCRVPSCCNPSHLQPVTDRENFLRGVHPSARFHKHNICKRGHVLSEEDIGHWSNGTRVCNICRRMSGKKWRENSAPKISKRRTEKRLLNIERFKELERVRGARYREKQRLAKLANGTGAGLTASITAEGNNA